MIHENLSEIIIEISELKMVYNLCENYNDTHDNVIWEKEEDIAWKLMTTKTCLVSCDVDESGWHTFFPNRQE